ncbi:ankyrin repeat-containing domain protein [Neocallimastix sp. 'constans']
MNNIEHIKKEYSVLKRILREENNYFLRYNPYYNEENISSYSIKKLIFRLIKGNKTADLDKLLKELFENYNFYIPMNFKTPLHIALLANATNLDVLEFLNSCNIYNINRVNKLGNTPLHEHLDNGANINKFLHELCSKVYRNKCIPILIKLGVDINKINNKGETTLFIACKYGKEDMVNTLMEYGADINITDNNNNNTP